MDDLKIIDNIDIEPEEGHKSHYEVLVVETDYGFRFQLLRWLYDQDHRKQYIKLAFIAPDNMVKIMRAVKQLGLKHDLFNREGRRTP